jgi:hypothetical protein
MRRADIHGAIIGGIAVVLHGHTRSTRDVDVFVESPELMASELSDAGFSYHRSRREFVRDQIPVHLVLPDQIGKTQLNFEEREGVTTVSLPSLIEMKLRSGTTNILRAQDLADVIGLIRARRLTAQFASRIDRSMRSDFRRLVRAIETERGKH